MASRAGWFILGFLMAIIGLAVAAYLFVDLGGAPMATKSHPLPFEASLASFALKASFAGSEKLTDPVPLTEANMAAGASLYRQHCAGCHGLPGHPPSNVAKGEYPPPPQLFENGQMVTDDPEGVTYWKITNGIRLTGMPDWESALSDTERWQLTMLLAHADKLAPPVASALEPK
jgi:thiosulfate dehydrogenase